MAKTYEIWHTHECLGHLLRVRGLALGVAHTLYSHMLLSLMLGTKCGRHVGLPKMNKFVHCIRHIQREVSCFNC